MSLSRVEDASVDGAGSAGAGGRGAADVEDKLEEAPEWWTAVDARGKEKRLPCRRGHGGGRTCAVMLETGDGTHCTVVFASRVPPDATPKGVQLRVRRWVESKDFGVVDVLSSISGMYGKNSALVDDGSELAKLVLGAQQAVDKVEGFEVDHSRKPHIEILKPAARRRGNL